MADNEFAIFTTSAYSDFERAIIRQPCQLCGRSRAANAMIKTMAASDAYILRSLRQPS